MKILFIALLASVAVSASAQNNFESSLGAIHSTIMKTRQEQREAAIAATSAELYQAGDEAKAIALFLDGARKRLANIRRRAYPPVDSNFAPDLRKLVSDIEEKNLATKNLDEHIARLERSAPGHNPALAAGSNYLFSHTRYLSSRADWFRINAGRAVSHLTEAGFPAEAAKIKTSSREMSASAYSADWSAEKLDKRNNHGSGGP